MNNEPVGLKALMALACLAGALGGCKTHAPAADLTPAKQHEENAAAGYMVRLGYDKWVAACGYEIAKRGEPRTALRQKCLADFHFSGPITGGP